MKQQTSLRQQIEDNQQESLRKQELSIEIKAARAMLCCPRDAAGRMVKEIITSYDKIRIIFEDKMQMVLSAQIERYDGNAELLVNYAINTIDLVEFGLLPESFAIKAKRTNLENEKGRLISRLKIIEANLSNNTIGITKELSGSN